jgi:hypothetical protein
VILVSELANAATSWAAGRRPALGHGLDAGLALPENQSMEKISNHAWYTFWYVLPTLPMFIAFPVLLPKLGFWPTLISSILITMASFGGFAILLRRFGIELL